MEVAWRMEKKGLIPIDLEMIQYLEECIGKPPLIVANKIDKLGNEKATILAELNNSIANVCSSVFDCIIFPVSAKTGEGLGDLKKKIHDKLIENGFKTPFKK
jgi:GTP-binding protein EngB required for normal cell division